jgi:hypothetical protein
MKILRGLSLIKLNRLERVLAFLSLLERSFYA